MTTEFWHARIDRYVSRLVARATGGQGRNVLRLILDQELPRIFKNRLLAFASEVFLDEQPVELKASARYDHGDPRLAAQKNQLQKELIRATFVTQAELRTISEKAVQEEVDLLLRPRQKLLDELFADKGGAEEEDVLATLAEHAKSRSAVTAILAAISGQRHENMLRQEAELLLKRAERKHYEHSPISALLSEINAYLEFESLVMGEDVSTLHPTILLTMLKERNLLGLYREYGQVGKEKARWTLPEIESTLQRYILIGSDEQDLSLPDDGSANTESPLSNFDLLSDLLRVPAGVDVKTP